MKNKSILVVDLSYKYGVSDLRKSLNYPGKAP